MTVHEEIENDAGYELNVLFTGATGFIGRHLVERLITAGEHVKAFVRTAANAAWLDVLGVEVRL